MPEFSHARLIMNRKPPKLSNNFTLELNYRLKTNAGSQNIKRWGLIYQGEDNEQATILRRTPGNGQGSTTSATWSHSIELHATKE